MEGDVKNTQSDNKLLKKWIGDYQKTTISEGIKKFVFWYKEYYGY